MDTNIPSWGVYFYDIAKLISSRSKDPSTKVGAVIIRNNFIISTGYNGFAPGVRETEKFWQRPTKYDRVIHAEVNAIAAAARAGNSTDGANLYVTHFPCTDCCKLIIAAGIVKIFTAPPPEGWDEKTSMAMFREAGVKVRVRK